MATSAARDGHQVGHVKVKEWVKFVIQQFEVAVRVRPTLETLTLILRPQSAIFSGGLKCLD